ncbi:holliday junction resolvase YEN1 [Emericellopsis cladophorae]|uniref:Holliday junction resolvase YEN1 n=1 Tax=Emericellopsis cladophorae TaxID=2686198 RepID=A0A9P9Y0Y1_9HYPO|nr:holliday junction resolvase YEN1 [Emericellopsis cladophorae]KAI6781524.1 holliday junction resolvase YEN1 [Emericellopsis cladophorae]
MSSSARMVDGEPNVELILRDGVEGPWDGPERMLATLLWAGAKPAEEDIRTAQASMTQSGMVRFMRTWASRAVDFAIWQFQSQAARGGTNPALRTLFYRLVRLMSTPVDPVFVFDGPDKPTFKRNKRAGRGDTATISQAKQLIRLLGFPIHDAPGEAEADCALLQQRGVVDAVLSEDVDTIMFGCTRSLRNWTAESRTAKTPTHVTQYDIDNMDIAGKGLDREGMVLVALMSGGDYLPDGILGCGVKVACEAAKAGYGRSLCKIKASDKQALADWRNSLIHELKTNESKFFRIKHSVLAQKVPEDFPNIEALKDSMAHHEQRPLHLYDLREFARTAFGWDYRVGGVKFIRVLGAALLTRQLLRGNEEHIERIAGSRAHFTTDGRTELRLRFIPENVVPVDLSEEVDEDIPQSRGSLSLNSDDELGAPDEEMSSSQPAAKIFDVSKPDLAWVLEDVVKKTAPVAYHDWQDAERVKALRKSPKKKATAKGAAKPSVTSGAMDKFVRVTKHVNPPVTAPVKKKAKDRSRSDIELPSSGPPPRPSKQSKLDRLNVDRGLQTDNSRIVCEAGSYPTTLPSSNVKIMRRQQGRVDPEEY